MHEERPQRSVSRKFYKQLKSELEVWQQQGTVSSEQAEAILSNYVVLSPLYGRLIVILLTLGAILALRASSWDQVRIFVVASLLAFALSLIGAAYYVFFVGVVALGLIVILIASLILTVGLTYYWWKYSQTE